MSGKNNIGRCGVRAREAVERECVCEGGSGLLGGWKWRGVSRGAWSVSRDAWSGGIA